MSLRLNAILAIAGLSAALVAVSLVVSLQTRKLNAHRVCLVALQAGRSDLDPAKVCEPIIASAHLVAARSNGCDAALTSRPENTYGVGAYCSTPIKTVQAERDVARAQAGRLTITLTNERLERDDVVARASAAATTQAERKARAALAIASAPRDGDGLVVCAADCLRARGETISERQRP